MLLEANTKVQHDEEIIEMMNGCICCTVRQDLVEVLRKLATRVAAGKLHLDGIIIETTGMADPAPVAQTFFVDYSVKAFARLDGIVTLVDAKHIEQHLDEEKPEGAENEAVEQVAFADRLLLNKTDLVTEDDLARVEARLRGINTFAPIVRCQQSSVHVSSVLNIGAFDLSRTLEMDPEFLNTDGEHEHDASVTSLSAVVPGDADFELLQDWVHALLQTQGPQLYRMKGVLAVAGSGQRLVFQGVHMIFKWSADEIWADGEPKVCKLVIIGKNLDHATLKAGFEACVHAPAVADTKAARARAIEQICTWAREALPAAFAGAMVRVAQVRCLKPVCPLEVELSVLLPKPKTFALPRPLLAVTRDDVVGVLHAWAKVLERAKTVQAWAVEALPKALAGQAVLVDELETVHVHAERRAETAIHVLASPPWSMRVLKPLDAVTKENVTNVMKLSQLCGSYGIPSVS